MNDFNLLKNKRCVEIFKKLVEIYIETGEPVGSSSLSKLLQNPLSPATVRNVMAELEDLEILCSTHTSSGRRPTEKGWRFFVNGLIESADLTKLEKSAFLEITKNSVGKSLETILEQATNILSELSNCVSLVMTPTINSVIKHIDFILLNSTKAIVIIVNENGIVENRLIDVPKDISSYDLEKATKYINTKLAGMTLEEIKNSIQEEVILQKEGIDIITKDIVERGIGFIVDDQLDTVIVKGHSNLVDKSNEISDLKVLLKKLDEKRSIKAILDQSLVGQGIQIFIGAETKMFEMSGCSMIVSPYKNAKNLIGAIGIIGPTRMKYSRVIKLVDYTAKLLGGLL